MSNPLIFALIFAVVLVIVGWVSAEYMSHSTDKKNKKSEQKLAILEREKSYLETQLAAETSKLQNAREEISTMRDAKDQIRTVQKEHAKLQVKHEKTLNGISAIRNKVANRRYASNSLAKDILHLLREHCPTEEEALEQASKETQHTFERIKRGIDNG